MTLDNNTQLLAQHLGDSVLKAVGTAEMIINLSCLQNLNDGAISIPPEANSYAGSTRLFRLTGINYENGTDIIQSLSNVFVSMSRYRAVILYLLRFDGSYVELYIGVNCKDSGDISMAYDTLRGSFSGNFSGCKGTDKTLTNSENEALLADFFDYSHDENISIASISGIFDKTDERQNFSSGLEQLIDGMRSEPFELVILAETLPADSVKALRICYEDLYSQLTPFRQRVLNISDSNTKGYAQSIGASITETLTKTAGISTGSSSSHTHSEGKSKTRSRMTPMNRAIDIGGAILSVGGMGALFKAGELAEGATLAGSLMGGAYLAGPLTGLLRAVSGDMRESEADTSSDSDTKTEHTDINSNISGSRAITQNQNKTFSDSITESHSLQYTHSNYAVEALLKSIARRIETLHDGESEGGFKISSYIIASNNALTNRAASLYASAIKNHQYSNNNVYINVWDKKEDTTKICAFLRQMTHPYISTADGSSILSGFTPATVITSRDAPQFFLMPHRSITGLTVTEHARFSRDVPYDIPRERKLNIGRLFHMGITENVQVNLDIESLSMHTFIAGTTGSGKSTAVYQIINELRHKGVNFMVIEPAKGDYKNVFGNLKDVQVFGTNQNYTPLLRIDPFSFPKGIHVLEHLDALIDLFNVCWPMYAAMPAILKDALERSYSSAGWNLKTSKNKFGLRIFPTFADVMTQVNEVLRASEYSSENKGNYIGSLCTRLKSMANGINGMIFTPDSVSDSVLFDSNVIIDISRIKSGETKALIMGLLILKLQEYRQVSVEAANQKLKHVTIIEEAHNLMRSSNVAQSGESSNLMQKSVEMIANTIAEVRTYGEGFIIADQAPGELDMSAIRNTNTKIILRLPNEYDREIAGRSMGLNNEQIQELSKLPTGVAAVCQNNWQGAVLVNIPLGSAESKTFVMSEENSRNNDTLLMNLRNAIIHKTLGEWLQQFGDISQATGESIDEFLRLELLAELKVNILKYAECRGEARRNLLRQIAYSFFNSEEALSQAHEYKDITAWRNAMINNLEPSVEDFSSGEIDFLLSLLIWTQYQKDSSYYEIYYKFADYLKNRSEFREVIKEKIS